MPDYKCGKVYAIVGEDGLEVYVGSTCSPLHKRWYGHKDLAKKGHRSPIYKYIAENGGFEKFRIILVEEYPCENRKQLERQEGEHIRRLKPVGNRNMAGATDEERERQKQKYRETDIGKQKHREYMRQYRACKTDIQKQKDREYQKEYHAKKKAEWEKIKPLYPLYKELISHL